VIRRLIASIRRLLGLERALVQAGGRVAYESAGCRECGRTNAVIGGLCWYHRTGNEPVEEPMSWDG
jgi:hypothetical protein